MPPSPMANGWWTRSWITVATGIDDLLCTKRT
jgi:hypothetical protein